MIASDFQSEATAFARQERFPGEEAAAAAPASVLRISDEDTKLEWHIGRSRQRQSRDLPPLYVRFRQAEEVGDFAAEYVTEEQNRSTTVQGCLSVKVTVHPQTSSPH